MTVKRELFGGGAPRASMSSTHALTSMSLGARPVHQTSVETVPGAECFAFVTGSCILATASFFTVTTLRELALTEPREEPVTRTDRGGRSTDCPEPTRRVTGSSLGSVRA